MSWKASAYVKGLAVAPNGQKLKRGEKLLLLVLADYHHAEKKYAWASTNTLARDALLARRYVQMLVESARSKGILCVEYRAHAEGDLDTNRYRFHAIDCEQDHEGGRQTGAKPTGKKAQGGGEKSSPPPRDHSSPPGGDHSSPRGDRGFTTGGDREFTTGGDRGITTVVKSETSPYKEEPQPKPPEEPQRSHTHTQAPALPFAPPPARAGVCVSVGSTPEPKPEGPAADLTLGDYRAYARAHSTFNAPDAWATTHYDLRDRDELVREWKEGRSPERVEQARSAPVDNRLTYYQAAQSIRSICAVHGREPLDIIEEYSSNDQLAEGVRDRLLEKFSPPRAAEAAAAQTGGHQS